MDFNFDPLLLARIQFGFTIAFHIIFPAFTIGLAAYIATLQFLWLRTDHERYERLARFWTKIFAVSFAMGVVSGVVLSYQLGTNWSGFSAALGNVLGPLLGYEVLTAFFLEATFLGIMLFGANRVPRGLVFASSLCVAVGTFISAFWILSANSWMQYPTGHEWRDGIAYPRDWLAILFNPTFGWRLVHMLTAAYLTTSFVVLAVGARYLLAGMHQAQARTMLRMGIGMAAILAPAQLMFGDFHGQDTARYQPAKLAAIEGHWNGDEAAPLVLFAWPDERAEFNRYQIAIPNLASLIITHEWQGRFPGLKDFAVEDRPPVLPVFFAFRLMVGIGLFMIAVALTGAFLLWRGTLFDSRRFLYVASHTWPLGFIAVLSGWIVTEVGRQPWVATGLLRTADAASPVLGSQVAVSLALFVIVYAIVFSSGLIYMNRLIQRGPAPHETPPDDLPMGSRPLRAATEDAV